MYKLFGFIKNLLKHPIGSKSILLTAKKFILFQAFFRLMKGEYVFTWIEGSKFIVSPGETGLTGNLYFGLHDFEDMSFLLHYLNEKDVFVDIGSNVGSYTILSGIIKQCVVHSFEPIPATFKKLKRNIDLNSNHKNINLYNVGLGEVKEQLYFTNSLTSTINHVVPEKSELDKIRIEVDTLDSYKINSTVVKIDVEGFEKSVLNGAIQSLNNKNLKVILIEFNELFPESEPTQTGIFELITSKGFIPYSYNPFKRELLELDKINPKGNNTMFLRGPLEFFTDKVYSSKKYLINGIYV